MRAGLPVGSVLAERRPAIRLWPSTALIQLASRYHGEGRHGYDQKRQRRPGGRPGRTGRATRRDRAKPHAGAAGAPADRRGHVEHPSRTGCRPAVDGALRRAVRRPRPDLGRARPLAQPALGDRAQRVLGSANWPIATARSPPPRRSARASTWSSARPSTCTAARWAAGTSRRTPRTRCSPPRSATAYVRGVQSAGIAACPKHYVANDFETERFTAEVRWTSGRCASCTWRRSSGRSATAAPGR